jgi:hypothetical protein
MTTDHDLIQGNINNLSGLGYVTAPVPTDILEKLQHEVDFISRNRAIAKKYNKTLVGQIEHEYELYKSKKFIQPFVESLATIYDEHYPFYTKNELMPLHQVGSAGLSLDRLWVNFQKKHEYNPSHNHSGLYSFVIWLKIPYNLEDELSLPNSNNATKRYNSCFTFYYVEPLGGIAEHVIPVDKTYEGTIALFPSKLHHSVNPFYTTDEERISISGNLYFHFK